MKRIRARIVRGSGNVFLDLGFPTHEAAVMLLRCEIAEVLRKWIDREGLTQAQAAKRLGVVQPREGRLTISWAVSHQTSR